MLSQCSTPYALRNLRNSIIFRTFRQIVAYDQGRSLSVIEEVEERGKAPYQNIILPVLFALDLDCALLFSWLLLTFFPIK